MALGWCGTLAAESQGICRDPAEPNLAVAEALCILDGGRGECTSRSWSRYLQMRSGRAYMGGSSEACITVTAHGIG
jgi:hypothetical protein